MRYDMFSRPTMRRPKEDAQEAIDLAKRVKTVEEQFKETKLADTI